MHESAFMMVAVGLSVVCMGLTYVTAPGAGHIGLRAGSDVLPAALAAAITAAGKLAQAQRESWVVVNDGVQLDTDNQPPKKAMDNWNATEASDAMSTSLGPWFAQYVPAFVEQNVTGAVLRRLSDDDLRLHLGVGPHAHRRLIHDRLSTHRPPPLLPPAGVDLWALCTRHRRLCHLLLQGMRFFPRMIGMAMYLGLPELCAWLIPEHFVVHAAFVFCFSLQPHLALAVVLCSQWSTCWFVQLCLANVALNNIMGAMYRHFHPPTPRAVFNRFMSDQLILASLMAYWGLFPYVPYVVSESIFYLTLGDELLRLLLGGLLVFLGTSLGLFILLLGMKRGVSGDEFVHRLRALFGTSNDRAQHWPPALQFPAWLLLDTATADAGDDAVPLHFVCPISKCVMALPTLVCVSGLTYDYDGISRWVEARRSDPQTRERAAPCDLAPNRALYEQIESWLSVRTEEQRRRRDLLDPAAGTWLQWVHGQLAQPYDHVLEEEGDVDYHPGSDDDESGSDAEAAEAAAAAGSQGGDVDGGVWRRRTVASA